MDMMRALMYMMLSIIVMMSGGRGVMVVAQVIPEAFEAGGQVGQPGVNQTGGGTKHVHQGSEITDTRKRSF